LTSVVQKQEEDLKRTQQEQARNINKIQQVNVQMNVLKNRVQLLEMKATEQRFNL
jgi:hypothetical protein